MPCHERLLEKEGPSTIWNLVYTDYNDGHKVVNYSTGDDTFCQMSFKDRITPQTDHTCMAYTIDHITK